MTAARIHTIDNGPQSRSSPAVGMPPIVFREYPEHVARCVAAIRERRKHESAVKVNGQWQ
jgi:hypothetical protein